MLMLHPSTCDWSHLQKALELKVPPLALVGLFAAMMWIAAVYSPVAIDLPGRAAIALILMSGGFAVSFAGVWAFRRVKTTVNPVKPEATTTMVTSGIYRYSRNPMYLGFLLALVGWAAFLADVLAFALLPLFVLYMNRFQITPEERTLAAKFPHEFMAYKSSVRRWI